MDWKRCTLWAAVATAAAAFALGGCSRNASGTPASRPEYYAVLLTNSQILVGKLDNLDAAWPVLTDVFYVQSVEDPEKKGRRNVLVKRGEEWHGPDRTILNAQHILIVEPVAPGSKLTAMMEQARTP
jgi:hypothetical protein